MATRRAKKINAARLSLFRMEEDEQPIETIVGWMPLGFANNLGMPDQSIYPSPPRDGLLGLSHDDWFDTEQSEGREALWGHSIAIAHVLVLVTDRRLIWLPLDGEGRTNWKATTAYATFTSKSLGQRSIELMDIDLVEAVRAPFTVENLPGGFSSDSYVRLQLASESPFGGEPYPIWTPSLIPGWFAEGDELQIFITNGQWYIASLLSVALDYVGIAVRPPDWASGSLSNLPNWKPLYLKSVES